ncbi:MAG: DUF177 domain-containing protein [Oscillospiraceae bacterium]|jgi:uncharacterized protein|nr:DUF177 domain-containing protein [Oscillospiraceae bacterium]
MILDIGRALQQPGEPFPFNIEEAEPSAEQSQRFPEGVFARSICVEGFIVGANETVFVRGSVCAKIIAECARCLKSFERSLAVGVHEVYVRSSDPGDPDRNVFQGHTLELEEQVYSTLLLALPIRSLCKEDCVGLCPICGANLNDCACEHTEGNGCTSE